MGRVEQDERGENIYIDDDGLKWTVEKNNKKNASNPNGFIRTAIIGLIIIALLQLWLNYAHLQAARNGSSEYKRGLSEGHRYIYWRISKKEAGNFARFVEEKSKK